MADAMPDNGPYDPQRELADLLREASERPVLCPDWCTGGCRAEARERRIEELRAALDARREETS